MTIGERFKEVRKLADEPKKKCSQADFGEMFKIGRDAVANIENGRVEPSELLIENVCNKFNVSYRWLRNGEEPMMMPEADSATAYINELLNDVDNPFVGLIKSIMSVYVDLSPEDKKKAAAFAASLSDKIKESRD